MFKASTDALSALAQATSERTTVAFFNSAEMRDTPEAVAICRAIACKLMAAAGLALFPPDTLSEAFPPPVSRGDAPAAEESKSPTPALKSSSTPRMPPAQEPPAGMAVLPASTPAAIASGGARPASAVKTMTATVSSPAPSAASSGAPGGVPPASAVKTTTATVSSPAPSAAGSGAASRGRRSLSTKQVKAATALAAGSKKLYNENDGFYVVHVFPVRDDGAVCSEDRKDAEGDDSSDDDSNAEYQKCVRVRIGQRLQRVFFPRCAGFFFPCWAGFFFLRTSSLRPSESIPLASVSGSLPRQQRQISAR